jgi:predicted transposase YdaD
VVKRGRKDGREEGRKEGRKEGREEGGLGERGTDETKERKTRLSAKKTKK